MDKDIAKRLMEDLIALSDPINAATQLTKEIENIEEQKELRRGLARVMSEIYDLMMPIIRQFPDLDPDKER
jgi:hypothetical protein